MQGKLIVFEGVEGCGKTTQIKRIADWLQAYPGLQRLQARRMISQIYLTREPGGTHLGADLRQLLLGTPGESHAQITPQAELLLYAADRAQHVQEMLKPWLAQGGIILCDRFTDSTIAYQGYGRGLNLDLIQQLNHIATDGLESDLTIWLDLDVNLGLARTKARGLADRMEQANFEFHRRVQGGFAKLANQYPHRIVRVDATGEQYSVTKQIQEILVQKFSQWYPDRA